MITAFRNARQFLIGMAIFLGLALTSQVCGADGSNPRPCTDPFYCSDYAELSGTISGPTKICIGQAGTWTLTESSKIGKKKRCDDPEQDVNFESKTWDWNYVGGPEPSDGFNEGVTFTATFTQPGEYTIKWNGRGVLEGDVCDDVIAYAEYSFEVVVPEPTFTVELFIDPRGLCPGEKATATGYITDTSFCDPGSYVVNWRIENDGGSTALKMSPMNGQVTLSQGETKEVEVTITMNGNAPGDISAFTLYGKHEDTEESGQDDLSVVKLLSVSRSVPDYQPWTPGLQVTAIAEIEGELGDKQILWELRDFHGGEVLVTRNSSSLTETFLIPRPGRFRVAAELCDRTVFSQNFVAWRVSVSPSAIMVNWDPLSGMIAPAWQIVVDWSNAATNGANLIAGEGLEKLRQAAGAMERDGNAMANALQQAAADTDAKITENTRKLEQYEAERIAKRAELAEQERLRDRLLKDIERTSDLMVKKQADILRLENQLNTPGLSNAQRLRIERELTAARRVLAGYVTSLEAYRASLGGALSRIRTISTAIESLTTQITDLGRVISGLRQDLNSLRGAIRRFSSALSSKSMLAIKAAARVGQVALAGVDIVLGIQGILGFDEAMMDIENRLKEVKEFENRHKKAIDAFLASKAERKSPPQSTRVVFETIPGGIPMQFLEFPDFWRTKDRTIPMSEARWEFRHLALWGGHEPNWGDRTIFSTSGATGSVTMGVQLYGNLGESTIYSRVDHVPASANLKVTSDGLTEEAAQALVETMLADDKAKTERRNEVLNQISNAISIIGGLITIGAVIFAIAGYITVATAAVIAGWAGAIILGIALIVAGIASIFMPAHELTESIERLYPSAAS